jgi:hypothetical protein
MDLSLAGSAFAALIWWVIPIGAVLGALIYVVWVSKFADKYANETNRSVGNFQSFQDSFRGVQVVSETPATRVPNEYLSDNKQPTEHLD